MTKPTWTIYHPNDKGTGSALRLELHPAHDQTDGSIFAAIAPQKTSESEPYPSMDWDKAISVKFDIIELAQILQVLRGCTESIADGKGLFHRTIKGNTVVRFVHFIEPVCGYKLDITRRPLSCEEEAAHLSFCLTQTEAFALSEVISHAMCYVAFGNPMVNE